MTTISIHVTVPIEAPASRVFSYLNDTSKFYLWNSGLVKIDPETILKEGDVYHTTSQLMGRTIEATNQVTRLIPDRQIDITNEVRPLTYRATLLLDQEDGTTNLHCDLDIEGATQIVHLARPVLEYMGRTRLEADYTLLKAIVEGENLHPDQFAERIAQQHR